MYTAGTLISHHNKPWTFHLTQVSLSETCLFVVVQERPRPTFAALAPTVERNPVTGILEPHFPDEKRQPRIFSGIAIVITMVRFQHH